MSRRESGPVAPPPAPSCSASGPIAARTPLDERVRAIKAQLRDAKVGPLRAALDVVDLLDHWERFRAEAGGLDGESWATQTFGTRGAAPYFRRRFEAVGALTALGWSKSLVLSRFDHDVAVYLTGETLADPNRKAAVHAVLEEQKSRGALVSRAIAKEIVGALLGRRSKRQAQDRKLALALAHIEAMYQAARQGEALPPLPAELAP